jgi:hypothetical protein
LEGTQIQKMNTEQSVRKDLTALGWHDWNPAHDNRDIHWISFHGFHSMRHVFLIFLHAPFLKPRPPEDKSCRCS